MAANEDPPPSPEDLGLTPVILRVVEGSEEEITTPSGSTCPDCSSPVSDDVRCLYINSASSKGASTATDGTEVIEDSETFKDVVDGDPFMMGDHRYLPLDQETPFVHGGGGLLKGLPLSRPLFVPECLREELVMHVRTAEEQGLLPVITSGLVVGGTHSLLGRRLLVDTSSNILHTNVCLGHVRSHLTQERPQSDAGTSCCRLQRGNGACVSIGLQLHDILRQLADVSLNATALCCCHRQPSGLIEGGCSQTESRIASEVVNGKASSGSSKVCAEIQTEGQVSSSLGEVSEETSGGKEQQFPEGHRSEPPSEQTPAQDQQKSVDPSLHDDDCSCMSKHKRIKLIEHPDAEQCWHRIEACLLKLKVAYEAMMQPAEESYRFSNFFTPGAGRVLSDSFFTAHATLFLVGPDDEGKIRFLENFFFQDSLIRKVLRSYKRQCGSCKSTHGYPPVSEDGVFVMVYSTVDAVASDLRAVPFPEETESWFSAEDNPFQCLSLVKNAKYICSTSPLLRHMTIIGMLNKWSRRVPDTQDDEDFVNNLLSNKTSKGDSSSSALVIRADGRQIDSTITMNVSSECVPDEDEIDAETGASGNHEQETGDHEAEMNLKKPAAESVPPSKNTKGFDVKDGVRKTPKYSDKNLLCAHLLSCFADRILVFVDADVGMDVSASGDNPSRPLLDGLTLRILETVVELNSYKAAFVIRANSLVPPPRALDPPNYRPTATADGSTSRAKKVDPEIRRRQESVTELKETLKWITRRFLTTKTASGSHRSTLQFKGDLQDPPAFVVIDDFFSIRPRPRPVRKKKATQGTPGAGEGSAVPEEKEDEDEEKVYDWMLKQTEIRFAFDWKIPEEEMRSAECTLATYLKCLVLHSILDRVIHVYTRAELLRGSGLLLAMLADKYPANEDIYRRSSKPYVGRLCDVSSIYKVLKLQHGLPSEILPALAYMADHCIYQDFRYFKSSERERLEAVKAFSATSVKDTTKELQNIILQHLQRSVIPPKIVKSSEICDLPQEEQGQPFSTTTYFFRFGASLCHQFDDAENRRMAAILLPGLCDRWAVKRSHGRFKRLMKGLMVAAKNSMDERDVMMSALLDEEGRASWELQSDNQNPDGKRKGTETISVEKASKSFSKVFMLPKELCDRLCPMADLDGDGRLDTDEFCLGAHLAYRIASGASPLVHLPKHLVPLTKRFMDPIVNSDDLDGQGPPAFVPKEEAKISKKELQPVLKKLPAETQLDVQRASSFPIPFMPPNWTAKSCGSNTSATAEGTGEEASSSQEAPRRLWTSERPNNPFAKMAKKARKSCDDITRVSNPSCKLDGSDDSEHAKSESALTDHGKNQPSAQKSRRISSMFSEVLPPAAPRSSPIDLTRGRKTSKIVSPTRQTPKVASPTRKTTKIASTSRRRKSCRGKEKKIDDG